MLKQLKTKLQQDVSLTVQTVFPKLHVPHTLTKKPVMEEDQMDYVLSLQEVQLPLLLELAN